MNKLKFRVWDIDGNCFVPKEDAAITAGGQFLSLLIGDTINSFVEDEIEVGIELVTGVHDLHGVEIFDGDILRDTHEDMVGAVTFDGLCFRTNCRGWGNEPMCTIDLDGLVVIGNRKLTQHD